MGNLTPSPAATCLRVPVLAAAVLAQAARAAGAGTAAAAGAARAITMVGRRGHGWNRLAVFTRDDGPILRVPRPKGFDYAAFRRQKVKNMHRGCFTSWAAALLTVARLGACERREREAPACAKELGAGDAGSCLHAGHVNPAGCPPPSPSPTRAQRAAAPRLL